MLLNYYIKMKQQNFNIRQFYPILDYYNIFSSKVIYYLQYKSLNPRNAAIPEVNYMVCGMKWGKPKNNFILNRNYKIVDVFQLIK